MALGINVFAKAVYLLYRLEAWKQ